MHRRLLVPALSLILAFVLLCALTPALASGATIAQKKAQAARIAAEVSALNTKVEIAVEAYDGATWKLHIVQGKIHTNQQQLIVARYNLLVARQELTQNVVSMYKQNKADVLDVLLSRAASTTSSPRSPPCARWARATASRSAGSRP